MTNGNPPDLTYSEPDLRALPPDDPDAREDPRPERPSAGGRTILLLGLALLAAGAGWYLWSTWFAPAPAPVIAETAPATPPPDAPAAAAEPEIQYPIDSSATTEPMPELANSDEPLGLGLATAMESDAIARYMVSQDFARRFVITVDNLARKTYSQRLSPFKPAPGAFAVAGTGDRMTISAQNPARYTPLVRVFEAVNSEKLVALYVRFYPLFQEAYREQGYPNAYFNDRLVQVLDMMIATREMPGQLALTQPKVLYEFADPALEALPAGQKILLRIGPENAARVKSKLREIRALVAQEVNVVKGTAKAP
ncbi:hypothetical protein BURK1_03681 [Burkholderiales bacterium]|nr:hypothetical protein BURK1_03681 [Burkholderiales bacterium]